MEVLNFESINCRGLNTYEKRLKLYTLLNDSECDIIFLQETHYILENEFKYNTRWHGTSVHCFSDSVHRRGVSILFRKGLNFDIMNIHRSNDGRKLLVNIHLDDSDITLINIYAPNIVKDRCEFFKKTFSWINKLHVTMTTYYFAVILIVS